MWTNVLVACNYLAVCCFLTLLLLPLTSGGGWYCNVPPTSGGGGSSIVRPTSGGGWYCNVSPTSGTCWYCNMHLTSGGCWYCNIPPISGEGWYCTYAGPRSTFTKAVKTTDVTSLSTVLVQAPQMSNLPGLSHLVP